MSILENVEAGALLSLHFPLVAGAVVIIDSKERTRVAACRDLLGTLKVFVQQIATAEPAEVG